MSTELKYNKSMNVEMIDFDTNNQPVAIDNNESATRIAHLLIEKLQELQNYVADGRPSYHLLKQLKDIVFCIYYSAEKQYTVLLHDIVSYVLIQLLKYEN